MLRGLCFEDERRIGTIKSGKVLTSTERTSTPKNDAAFYWALETDIFEVVKYLIEQAGADPHVNDKSALMYSAENGHVEIVKYLVEHGENIHTSENSGFELWYHAWSFSGC